MCNQGLRYWRRGDMFPSAFLTFRRILVFARQTLRYACFLCKLALRHALSRRLALSHTETAGGVRSIIVILLEISMENIPDSGISEDLQIGSLAIFFLPPRFCCRFSSGQ